MIIIYASRKSIFNSLMKRGNFHPVMRESLVYKALPNTLVFTTVGV